MAKKLRIRIPDDRFASVINSWVQNGMTYRQVAKKLGVPNMTLWNHVKRLGLQMDKRLIPGWPTKGK